MDDDYQIEIPPSFHSLYMTPSRRLAATRDEIRASYEHCETLANQLVDYARAIHLDHGIAEDEVLGRCRAGLLLPESGMQEKEADWVIRRLAELLQWDTPTAVTGPT